MTFLTIETYHRYSYAKLFKRVVWLSLGIAGLTFALAWVFVYNINQNSVEAAQLSKISNQTGK